MKPTSRLGLIALTHGLAIAFGWAAYHASGFQSAGSSPPEPPASRTKAADRTPQAAGAAEAAGEILAPILASVKIQHEAVAETYDAGAGDDIPQTSQEILDRIANIGLPADFASALDELKKNLNQKNLNDITALSFHWMNQDSKAFFAWLRANNMGQQQSFGLSILYQLEPEIYRRSGVGGVVAQIANAEGFKHQLIADLGRSLAKSGNAADIFKARELLLPDPNTSDPANWRALVKEIGENWPNDKTAALIQLAVDLNAPMILITHRQSIAGQGSYIAGLLADQSLPEDFRRKISENPSARNAMASDPSLPLETRLKNGGYLQEIIRTDVGRLLSKDRDWAFAFRNGEATADEIMTVISTGSPDLAKSQPDELRDYVFRELSEENPTAAMVLLKDMPEDKRGEFALLVSRTHFNDVEPSKFLELLEQVPSDTPEQWEGRLDAWNLRGFKNNERLQDGYVEWVRALPPGLDREMALYSLARAVNAKNPGLAEDLRSQVSDPELKKRIASHR